MDGGHGLIGSCSVCCDGTSGAFIGSGSSCTVDWCGYTGYFGGDHPTVHYLHAYSQQETTLDLTRCPSYFQDNQIDFQVNSASCAISASGYLSQYNCSDGTTTRTAVTYASPVVIPPNSCGPSLNCHQTGSDYFGGNDWSTLVTSDDAFNLSYQTYGGTMYEQDGYTSNTYTQPFYYTDVLPAALTCFASTPWVKTSATFYTATSTTAVSVKGGEYAILISLPTVLTVTQSYFCSWSLNTTDQTGSLLSSVGMSTTVVGSPGQHQISSSWYYVAPPASARLIAPTGLTISHG